MWFEDRSRSQSNMKVSSLIVEEWRDIWSTKPEFMFAALAYLFATTNLINLPRLILENGGPAFLVAYGASMLAVVLPILLLELSVGQLTGRAPVQSFYNICPALKGVGLAQILFSIIVMACMTRFLGWVLFYIYHLFWTLADDRPGLPWLHCLHFPEFHFGDCLESASPLSTAGGNGTLLGSHSQQGMATLHPDSAMAQFGSVLDAVSDSIDQPVQIQLHWLVAHGTIWALVFCAICFGVRWLGKVVLFTLTVPLLLLMALCGRALLLDGAPEMFRQLLVDALDWERLKDVWLWKTAVEQAILACGLGFGAFITMGSYNKRSNNLVKDGFLLLIGHCMISVLQVATVVALVGHVSQRVGLSANDLLQHGEHQFHQLLVYFAYISHTKLFTAIFLFMVAFSLLNIFFLLSLSVLATLEDALGEKWSRCCPRFTLAMLVCSVGFASSLYFTTEAGKHGYELATGYLKYATLAAILASELFTVAWLFGAHSLGLELRQMLHSGCSWCMGHFLLLFTFLLPAVPIAIACLNLMGYSYAKYSPEVRAWPWSEWAGIGIAILPLLPIPLWKAFAIVQSCRRRPRISYCRRIGLAFRSPLRHELMKSSMMSSSVGGPSAHHLLINPPAHNNHNNQQLQQQQLSARYSAGCTAAVNSGGYMLLPQAPLAQPEPDDAVGGPESGRSVGGGGGGGSARHQQQQQPTAQHHRLSTSTSTLRAADSSSTSVRRTGSEHGPYV